MSYINKEILTIEDFISKCHTGFVETVCKGNYEAYLDPDDVKNQMIAFAKYHVNKALEYANNNAELEIIHIDELTNEPIYGIDSKSILNAYPEHLIK